MDPTWVGSLESEEDAWKVVERCLQGELCHLPRRPREQEWSSLCQVGHVYVYEKNASGFEDWDDGLRWTCTGSRSSLRVYMATPLFVEKRTVTFELSDTFHHVVTYQPMSNTGTLRWML